MLYVTNKEPPFPF